MLARIATGGMGEIFLARLEGAAGFEKLCVIKRILPHLADDARFRSMLIAEARIASNMSHANICHVYELDETNNQLYLVMEYLEGVTVLQLLRSLSRTGGQLDLGFVAGIMQQACEGLHYAHELRDRNGGSLGVVHRDITPSNLFVTESGVVKIVDFGIAKAKDSQETNSGAVKGKYAYMAPEQLRGMPIDRRADLFSLAIVAFEMLTCRRLYQRETDYLTFRAVMEDPMIDVRKHRPEAPAEVTAVLARALDRDPAGRFQTARQFGQAFADALGGVRPWGQGDISEMVRLQFADELSSNNAEISSVIRRSDQTASRAIPVIMQRTSDPNEPDYMSIETDVGEQPVPSSSSSASLTSSSSGEQRSFSQVSHVRSEVFGQPMSVGPQASQVITLSNPSLHPPAPRANTAIPLVAVVGSAAVVMMVGLMMLGGPAERAPKPAVAAAAPAPRTRPVHTPRAEHEPYRDAVRVHERELDQCARDHRAELPSDARAVLEIGLNGRVTKVAIKPELADRSTLASCIRGVLNAITFPAATDVKEVALGLAVY